MQEKVILLVRRSCDTSDLGSSTVARPRLNAQALACHLIDRERHGCGLLNQFEVRKRFWVMVGFRLLSHIRRAGEGPSSTGTGLSRQGFACQQAIQSPTHGTMGLPDHV
jgi:hypothetical protein